MCLISGINKFTNNVCMMLGKQPGKYWVICWRYVSPLVITVSITICLMLFVGWSWSYGSWMYNYLCNQCVSPLKLWVRIPFMTRCFSIQHYVIKFVNDLRQVGGFIRVFRFPPPIKLIATIYMKCCCQWR